MSPVQIELFETTQAERRVERSCHVCHGSRLLCRDDTCPIKLKARTLSALKESLTGTSLFGSSPPAVFIGQHGYPKVSAGPLVPPIVGEETWVMDAPEAWLYKSLDEILGYRLSLLRGRTSLRVEDARSPGRFLSAIQEIAMAELPTDAEIFFKKKPRPGALILPREAPMGPSATMVDLRLAGSPRVPRPVEYVVSDLDLDAEDAVLRLYDSNIPQRQITRLLSVGLLGASRRRRLVPTEWSITAVDDIVGEALRREILSNPQVGEFMVFGHKALANNVQILLLPSAWMFEVLEAWLASTHPIPCSDYELTMGRKEYPTNIVGAYHATRLPILEYLRKIRRQAGAVAFLEVDKEWIPLGVWRFREIAREALRKQPLKFRSLRESLEALADRLKLPMEVWIRQSKILRHFKEQKELEGFLHH